MNSIIHQNFQVRGVRFIPSIIQVNLDIRYSVEAMDSKIM